MKNKSKIAIVLMYCCITIFITNTSFAQQNGLPKGFTPKVAIAPEQVFLHINSTFFLPGETLFYKVYCMDVKTKQQSRLSKISYVELINEERRIVFTHKIKMKDGVGQGDYFIPASLPSGNYKIIGFTQLSKNLELDYLFQNNITIVNPYQGNQKKLLSKINDSIHDFAEVSPELEGNKNVQKFNYQKTINSTLITLQLSDTTVSTRERVGLTLKSSIDDVKKGNYSVSIRRIDTIKTVPKHSPVSWKKSITKIAKDFFWESDIVIPEFRGDMIRGTVVPKNGNEAAENYMQNIAISIPGKGYELRILRTDKNGNFWVAIENEQDKSEMIAQVLGADKNSFDIKMEFYPDPKIDYTSVEFERFYIYPDMKQMILDRSIQNQIKNSFFSVKKDTVKVIENSRSPISRFYDLEYTLDDFTRFPSVAETVIEVIDQLWITKDKSGVQSFRVRLDQEFAPALSTKDAPLVVVDGLLLQDHELLISYPAAKIKKMNIIRDVFVVGAEAFSGVLEVETFDKNFFEGVDSSYVYKFDMFTTLANKTYFKQQYQDSLKQVTDRIPDFRNQLLWDPSINITKGENNSWFYTSDNKGVYEIDLAGFTAKGKPVSIRRLFTVK